ncbi:MAG: hypothetical protein AB8B99_23005 [Phormidesmis sp.]
MQRPISTWQNGSTNWQSAFFQENSMILGHQAWQGYLAQDRGIVACTVTVEKITSTANYQVCYIPLSQTSSYFKKNNLKAAITDRLINNVQTYRPKQEILVFIERQGEINICLLKNLAISPFECYRQVCNRWEEFYAVPRPVGGY